MPRTAELESDGLIVRFEATNQELENCILLAERDLSVADSTADADWAFNIAYNAMLQAGRAWMFSQGFRPRGETGHVAVVQFAGATLGKDAAGFVAIFDSMRRKRHRAVYDEPGIVSGQEVRSALSAAKAFLALVKRKIG